MRGEDGVLSGLLQLRDQVQPNGHLVSAEVVRDTRPQTLGPNSIIGLEIGSLSFEWVYRFPGISASRRTFPSGFHGIGSWYPPDGQGNSDP